MSVLRGEGETVILYGAIDVPDGPRIVPAYLARPDLVGEWPTVLVLGPTPTVTSPTKDLCRRLARHGLAAMAPERSGGPARVAAILAGVVSFLRSPAGFWSTAREGLGVLGLETGADVALGPALRLPGLRALGLVGPSATVLAETLPSVSLPIIGFSGKEDPSCPVAAVRSLQAGHPRLEWVLYDGVGRGYWDVDAAAYEERAATDTLERLAGFLRAALPARR